jgi:hypothetical protein
LATNFDKAETVGEAFSVYDGGIERNIITAYNGDPNGNVTATIGALCVDYSGTGKLWKNTTGSTSWSGVGGSTPYARISDTQSNGSSGGT